MTTLLRLAKNDPTRHGYTAEAVTPHDVNTLVGGLSRELYIGGAGNITVRMAGGGVVPFLGLPAGAILRIAVSGVNATGTTATNIVAIY